MQSSSGQRRCDDGDTAENPESQPPPPLEYKDPSPRNPSKTASPSKRKRIGRTRKSSHGEKSSSAVKYLRYRGKRLVAVVPGRDPDVGDNRFKWTPELHDDFMAALFDIGLQHASVEQLQQFGREVDPTAALATVPHHRLLEMMKNLRDTRQRSASHYLSYGRLISYRAEKEMKSKDYIFNKLCLLVSEIVYCKIKAKVCDAGPQLARIMNSVELQNILKETLDMATRTLQVVSTTIALKMTNSFLRDEPHTLCIT